jgi:hypothetical protein
VIFTSGSTGLPKGVMIEHKSLSNLIQWNNNYYNLTETDKTTKYAGFGFDASVHEMFPPLAAGAEIHIIPEEMRLDVHEICNYMENNSINVGFFPTPVCEMISRERCKSLQKIITGGDRLKRHSDSYIIYNNYGPTECTVLTTVFKVDKYYDNIPIGKPITNTQVYIVNDKLQLQPTGVLGEILIGGVGVARGYINDPEKTVQSFIHNPFNEGEIVYRTGDLGRWLPDGNIEYCGRNDNQVKIRGNRVELGEIEAVCLKCCGFIECVAVSNNKNDRIILFYTSEKEIIDRNARDEIKKYLPLYMIPDEFIKLKNFKLSPNGKIDRNWVKQLQTDDVDKNAVRRDDAVTDTERTIIEIWKEVLGGEYFGVNDNFFEVGGTSLSLVAMFSKLNQKFPGVLKVADIFAYPTIEQLAEQIQRGRNKKRAYWGLVRLKSSCMGGTQKVRYQAVVNRGTVSISRELFRTVVLFVLARFSEDGIARIEEKQQDGTYITIECNTRELKTLREIEEKTELSKNKKTLSETIRNPMNNSCICGINTDILELFDAENETKSFDIWIGANLDAERIQIYFEKNKTEISNHSAKQMLDAIVKVLNTVITKNSNEEMAQ